MNIKEASIKFYKSENQIRSIIKQGLLKTYKVNNRIVIPDDIKVIMLKSEIQAFLWQVLKYKNNPNMVLSYKFIKSIEQLNHLYEYLLEYGFIGKIEVFANEKDFFDNVNLTDEGLEIVLGKRKSSHLNALIEISIHPRINVGLINL